MNYVRKLGFEEAPDYGFLRDLFLKVLKNIGETDDRMFDWCLLNNGKGWEHGSVSRISLLMPRTCLLTGVFSIFSVPKRRKLTWPRCRQQRNENIVTVSIVIGHRGNQQMVLRRPEVQTALLSSSRQPQHKSRTATANGPGGTRTLDGSFR